MEKTRPSRRIDMRARAGALLLAVMYGSGFVVVTLLETNLLDENEYGYYVTAGSVGAQAYFIPRESVAFMKFEQADTVVRPTKSGY